MENVIDGITILLSWEILASAICIYALTHIVKRTVMIMDNGKKLQPLQNSKLYKIILTILPVVFGAAIAFHPTFLPGNTFTSRMIAGIVAGFLSNYFYQFIKRVFEQRQV